MSRTLSMKRVAAQLEGLAAMKLQGKGPPDAADAALAESGSLGEEV
jgi:hypothetical protein